MRSPSLFFYGYTISKIPNMKSLRAGNQHRFVEETLFQASLFIVPPSENRDQSIFVDYLDNLIYFVLIKQILLSKKNQNKHPT